jgi:hypothetical protein
MKELYFGSYKAELDMDSTAKWYAQYNGWGCECSHCRNFLKLASQKKLPKYIIETLDGLGILPDKATYVCELFTDDAGIHYQFSYRIAGIIIHIPNTYDGENCNDVRCCHESYPYGAPNFPEPHFDLEFYATLPWILDEAQSG